MSADTTEQARLDYLARTRARLRGEPEPPPLAPVPTLTPTAPTSAQPSAYSEASAHEALGRLVAELDDDEARAVVNYARTLVDARRSG